MHWCIRLLNQGPVASQIHTHEASPAAKIAQLEQALMAREQALMAKDAELQSLRAQLERLGRMPPECFDTDL